MPPARHESEARPGTILQRGRAKAYRPLPPERRAAILAEGLAAYDRGDFFLAHELLEPAWMGASDPAERDLYQGLIKLAAAFVHEARGNPAGVRKNLLGARERLAEAGPPSVAAGLDVTRLQALVDERLASGSTGPIAIPRFTRGDNLAIPTSRDD
ncbi:MAG: DUF309 domain-containing protein [Chloroflexi bacterium]|nr:DUF309 domain-containing protein [Chloroflexota bacterium]